MVSVDPNTILYGTVVSASDTGSVLLPSSFSSIESTYNGYDFVITGGTGYITTDIVLNRYVVANYAGATRMVNLLQSTWNGKTPDNTTTFELYQGQLGINNVVYYEESPVVSQIGFTASSIDIFKLSPPNLYNSYMPIKFDLLKAPVDTGWYLLPFSLHPLEYQPSGSFNTSTCREVYLKFQPNTINDCQCGIDLILIGKAINFLIVADGSLTLRYI